MRQENCPFIDHSLLHLRRFITIRDCKDSAVTSHRSNLHALIDPREARNGASGFRLLEQDANSCSLTRPLMHLRSISLMSPSRHGCRAGGARWRSQHGYCGADRRWPEAQDRARYALRTVRRRLSARPARTVAKGAKWRPVSCCGNWRNTDRNLKQW